MATVNVWSSATPAGEWIERHLVCCNICGQRLLTGQPVVDKHVYKGGELSYIALAHERCVVQEVAVPEPPAIVKVERVRNVGEI
jgi:hypothetical protein